MKKKIMIIEDERDLVKAVSFRLEDAGYEVAAAYDGEEGLKKVRSEHPDLILLDLMLPKMNGYKVCEALKSDSNVNKIPVIMFTARAQDTDRKMSQAAGVDAYITKPFESSELLATIKKLLER
ncbi:MAG: response regulator [Candidatus Omnitrophota bacterium]|nr:response regulator [Candidatus Omnitrophota bacterium]